MPTEIGSPIYRGNRPRADAACIALMKAAGAVVIGKTVTAEFAGTTPGKTANPLDPLRTPRGSSSGSAAAVADYMAAGALGTQTGGSVLRPSSFCGVFGYKPSFGRYNRAGVKPAAESVDTLGLIARSLEDLRLFDAALVHNPPGARPLSKPPIIGFCRTHLRPRAEASTVNALDDTARRLKDAGAVVREIDPPADFADLTSARECINNYERAQGLAYEWHNHRAQISERLAQSIVKGFAFSWDEYSSATEFVRRWRRDVGELFGDCELFLTPCVPGEVPKGLGDTGDPKFQELWTLLNPPSLALPTHRGENDLPVAIQLVGRPGGDAALLAVADWIWAALSRPV